MATLAELDPRRIVPNPRNPRFDLPDLEDLTASIKAVGVLQPIVVFPNLTSTQTTTIESTPTTTAVPDDQTYMILIGHRRHAVALQLGLAAIPCLIGESEADAEQLVKILAEAGKAVGLSVLEEANAFHQLELLDWTPEQIATATAHPLPKVRNALSIHHLPAQARQVAARVADTGELDLEQVAALEEFAGDPKVMDRITQRATSGPWGFRHAIAEEQKKREHRQQLERLRAELTLAGVRIVPRPQQWGYGSREAEASTLLNTAGEPLDPELVKARPGFAAFIDTQNLAAEPRAVIICVDPEAWGYTRSRRTSYVPDDQKAEADAEARRQAQHQAELATAAGVRRTFLERTYGTARAAKKVYLDALRDAVRDPATIRVSTPHEDLATTLAGADFSEASTAGIDRLTRMLVARWLTAAETTLQDAVLQRWNRQPAAARDYLDRLTAAGYSLSEAEQTLYADLVAEITADAEEDPDDEDTDPGSDNADSHDPDVDSDADEDEDEQDGDGRDRGDESDTGPGADAANPGGQERPFEESGSADQNTPPKPVHDSPAESAGPDAAFDQPQKRNVPDENRQDDLNPVGVGELAASA
ncbi:MAG TPA: ParB/RepB/Spo0J family partition protein [Propionibacteriaceae bacterium]|nr:ParB/RepB/Spo0J family partition protein [Propionibacteriaceae bacterium]